ncbi:hypothetical protein LVJ94_31535 [Pendulispora rubella]|uniref:Uncharacterized protein n=1 Tax=Pendulispora rubella TaxID=2741070 RepID=A0ABZ2KUL0_9BACT
MSNNWKSCGELVPSDFERYPVWSFDLQRGETDPKADETWVRPLGYQGFDRTDDELFVKAKVADCDGNELPDCILCVRLYPVGYRNPRGKSEPEISALILLRPRYMPLMIRNDRFGEDLPPTLQNRLPLTYEIDVPLGGRKRLSLAGSIGSRSTS